MLAVPLDLPLDPGEDALAEGMRRNEQSPVFQQCCTAGQAIEQVSSIGTDSGIGGEHAEVRVHPGRSRVIIPGAQVDIGSEAVLFPPHDHADLGMHLESGEAIDDMYPRSLKCPCPTDIVLLVEPGLELDQGCHHLTILPGFKKGIDDR